MKKKNDRINSSHRKAMFRNMVTSLLEHEQVRTTAAKAKEVRRLAERMITLGKRGGLHARRRALRVIRSKETAGKLFGPLAELHIIRLFVLSIRKTEPNWSPAEAPAGEIVVLEQASVFWIFIPDASANSPKSGLGCSVRANFNC